ncbi:MAG TPA: EAL domain-containing protein [Rhodospirillaceae bacterium]|nr:EAL domain-containing protein [Rhodospirillaceae bacterium]
MLGRIVAALPAIGHLERTRPVHYLMAAALVAVALALRMVIAPQDAGAQFVTFYPAVMLVAVFGGFGPAMVAAVIACGLADCLFFPPFNGVNVSNNAVLSVSVFFTDEVVVCGAIAAMQHHFRQRKLTEAALHESEFTYRTLFDNMLNGTAYCRMIFENGEPVDFVHLKVNKSFDELTGIKQAVGKTMTEVFPGIRQKDPEFFIKLGRVAMTGQQEKFEIYLNTLKHWLALSVYCPQPEHFVAVFDVITERKAAETNLRIAAAAFDAREGIVITDAGETILRVNQAFLDMTGFSAAEVVGQTPRLFKSGRHDAAFYAGMWNALGQTGAWQGEIWDRRKNGEVYPKWLSIKAVTGADGRVSHYVAIHTDITERKAAEEQIKNLAFYDPLTQLPNRRLFMDRLHQALSASIRNGREGALLFLDLDKFKLLNDTLGHDKGDLLLQQVAVRLTTCIREIDTVARLGGDEFIVLLGDLSENSEEAAAQAKLVGEKILAAVSRPYLLAGHDCRSTPSVGITLFGDKRDSIDDLLKQADIAMYQAKAAGRSTLRFFDPDLQATVQAHSAMIEDLRLGLKFGQFSLYYQPQVENGRIIGAEALIRWQHPERGLVAPADFIPLAEETGLILPLGQWVLESACARIFAWADRPGMADLTVAVNVSAHQLRQHNFVEEVLSAVDRTNADPHKLKLELTESMLIDNIEDVITKMNALKSYGIRFSLDDFGTGYSSLSYLKRLPLGQLKIDRSFVTDVLNDANDAAIAQTIVALGQTLGLKVIAEGVETEAQRDFLAEHGCNAYQGYLFSRPVPVEEFESLLESAVPA